MNAKTSKRKANPRQATTVGEMAPEYRFDYSKARPNRFAKLLSKDAVMIVLDPDVAKVFRNSDQVNALLRATIAAVGKRPGSRRR